MVIPVPAGRTLRPFQMDGITWLAERFREHGGAFLADEMGLGKSPQSACLLNCLPWRRTLIVVPASLRLNWRNELQRWVIDCPAIGIVWDGKTAPGERIVICSYELLVKHQKAFERQFDLVIFDEFHYAKSVRARRSKACKAVAAGARYRLGLTGTPILNAPWELVSMLDVLGLLKPHFKDAWAFYRRYCDLHNNGFGMDFKGSSNLGELQHKLKPLMLRRLKKDVLKDLPPKTRQVIELPPTREMRQVMDAETRQWALHEETIAALVARRDRAVLCEDQADYKEACALLKAASGVAFAQMATVRKETALAKLPLVLQHVRDALESVPKLIVMAHHKAVVSELLAGLKDFQSVALVGDTAQEQRQAVVDGFQNDPACRVFIGSIEAAGVGITLTAAALVCFAEITWTPAKLSQAEDRAHRLGQASNVLVQHLVLEGSLDSTMVKRLIAKQEVIDHAVDGVAPAPSIQATPRPRQSVDFKAVGRAMSESERQAVLRALRLLAREDQDRAGSANGKGFDRYHSQTGHELAARISLEGAQAGYAQHLVRRYRAQLDPLLLRECGIG
jgi:SWI/SNF-related matrix-associated actin-dependent regulator 1 of chromatin subfamily A